jgi:hypothetical protein
MTEQLRQPQKRDDPETPVDDGGQWDDDGGAFRTEVANIMLRSLAKLIAENKEAFDSWTGEESL